MCLPWTSIQMGWPEMGWEACLISISIDGSGGAPHLYLYRWLGSREACLISISINGSGGAPHLAHKLEPKHDPHPGREVGGTLRVLGTHFLGGCQGWIRGGGYVYVG